MHIKCWQTHCFFCEASILFFKRGQDQVNLWFMLKKHPCHVYLQCMYPLLILSFHKQLLNCINIKKRLCQNSSTTEGWSKCFVRGVQGWRRRGSEAHLLKEGSFAQVKKAAAAAWQSMTLGLNPEIHLWPRIYVIIKRSDSVKSRDEFFDRVWSFFQKEMQFTAIWNTSLHCHFF